MPLGCQVEGLGREVGTADHRLDPGVVVVDHHNGGRRRRVAEVVADRFFGRFLQVQVQRRLDFEAAEEGLGGAVAFDQLLAQVGGEVGRPRVEGRRFDAAGRGQRLFLAFAHLFFGDVALFAHFFEHHVAATKRVFGIHLGVESRGGGDDPRQGCGLPGIEDRGAGFGRGAAAGVRGAEIGAGGGLDPVGPLAEVDRVQILGEDFFLAPVLLEAVGERGLAELLQHGAAAFGFERVLDELLGDRRGSLLSAAADDVADEGATDPAEVDAVVLVEAGVLNRDHRVLDVGRDLCRAEEDFVLVAGQRPDRFAVVVEDLAVLRGLVLGEVVDRREILGDRGHHPEDHRDHGEDAEPEQDEENAQLLQPRLRLLGRRGRPRRGGRDRGRRGRRNFAAVVAPTFQS